MSEGSAVFRAIADWAQLRREAKRAAKDLKDTRSAVRDLDESLGDLDKSGDDASQGLGKVSSSAKTADRDVKGLLGSMQQWARIKAKATLGLDAVKAKADIQRIKDDLAGLRVTKLQLHADTARAKSELNDVQGDLAQLRTQPTSAKVTADIGEAERRITELIARIASIRDARLRVDADTARARAQLAAVSRETDQLGRKRPTVKVDVDTSKLRVLGVVLGALTAAAALIGPVVGAVTALAAGLFSVASAAAPAVGGLLGVAAAAGAVAQAVGVAAIALSGVGKAVKALQAKQASSGSTAASSAKQQQAAADRIAAAQRGVTRAVEQRNRTAIQGREAIEAAERGVASAVESSARRIAAAERAHADAVRDVERARADLNRELALAQERMEDLTLAAEGGVLDEEAATIRLQRAQQDLARVRRLGGSGLDLKEAQQGVKQAEHDLKVIQESNADLAQEVKKAAQSGVEGDEQVIAARERVAEATQGVQDAEAELHQARADARAEVADAERQLSQTIQQAAWANADAQLAVVDATRELSAAQREAGSASDAGVGKVADDFDKASPAAQRFARFLNDEVLPALRGVRDEIQARALPKFETAIRIAMPLLDLFKGKLGDTADIIGDLSIRAAQMMTSGPWTRDFGTILDSNNRIIQTLGDSGLVAMDALRILWVVAGPLAERLALLVLRGLEAARAFLESKRASGELAAFMTRAGDVIEQLLRIVGNFLVGLWNMGKAAAPAGRLIIDALEGASRKFREFTGSAEGQNKLRDYFLAAVPIIKEMGRLIVDLVTFFGRLATDPDTAAFIHQLRTEFLPALDRMITALGDHVVPLLISLGTHLGDVLAILGGGALVGFLVTLNGIAAALEWLLAIPGLGEFVGFVLTLAGAGYALSLVGGAITGIATALKILGPALTIARIALQALGAAALANPIVAIAGAIAIAALLIYQNWDTIKAWWTDTLWPGIKGAAEAVWNFLGELFSMPERPEAVRKMGEAIKGFFGDSMDWIRTKGGETWDAIQAKTAEADTWMRTKLNELGTNLKATFSDAWTTAGDIVSGAWEFINGTSEEKAAVTRSVLQGIDNALGTDFAGAWDHASQKVADVWGAIQRTIDGAIEWIERQIQRISNAWDALKAKVSSGISTAASYIPGFQKGGMVGGTGNKDDKLITTTAGEWVVPKDVTARFLPFLKAITFGSLSSVTQIIQPQEARLIQDRLGGVPDLSHLAGLRELMTATRGASTTTVDNSDNSRGVNVVTNIYNPIAEPASDSVADRMRTLSLMGAFS